MFFQRQTTLIDSSGLRKYTNSNCQRESVQFNINSSFLVAF